MTKASQRQRSIHLIPWKGRPFLRIISLLLVQALLLSTVAWADHPVRSDTLRIEAAQDNRVSAGLEERLKGRSAQTSSSRFMEWLRQGKFAVGFLGASVVGQFFASPSLASAPQVKPNQPRPAATAKITADTSSRFFARLKQLKPSLGQKKFIVAAIELDGPTTKEIKGILELERDPRYQGQVETVLVDVTDIGRKRPGRVGMSYAEVQELLPGEQDQFPIVLMVEEVTEDGSFREVFNKVGNGNALLKIPSQVKTTLSDRIKQAEEKRAQAEQVKAEQEKVKAEQEKAEQEAKAKQQITEFANQAANQGKKLVQEVIQEAGRLAEQAAQKAAEQKAAEQQAEKPTEQQAQPQQEKEQPSATQQADDGALKALEAKYLVAQNELEDLKAKQQPLEIATTRPFGVWPLILSGLAGAGVVVLAGKIRELVQSRRRQSQDHLKVLRDMLVGSNEFLSGNGKPKDGRSLEERVAILTARLKNLLTTVHQERELRQTAEEQLATSQASALLVPGLQARVAELEPRTADAVHLGEQLAASQASAGLVPGLQARVAELEGQSAVGATPTPNLVHIIQGRIGDFDLDGAVMQTLGERGNQEDAFFLERIGSTVAGVVADGMGGHNAGDVASREAVDQVKVHLENGQEDVKPTAAEILSSVHQELHQLQVDPEKPGHSKPNLEGMGTTAAVVLLRPDGTASLGAVGDSRIYFLRGDQFGQLFPDDTLEWMTNWSHLLEGRLEKGGVPDWELYKNVAKELRDPRNVGGYSRGLLQFLGQDQGARLKRWEGNPAKLKPPHEDNIDLKSGDQFLVVSDGVTGPLPDPVIESVLRFYADRPAEKAVDALMKLAAYGKSAKGLSADLVEQLPDLDEPGMDKLNDDNATALLLKVTTAAQPNRGQISAGLEEAGLNGRIFLDLDPASALPLSRLLGNRALIVVPTPTDARHLLKLGVSPEQMVGILWGGLEERNYWEVDRGINSFVLADLMSEGWKGKVISQMSARFPGRRVVVVEGPESFADTLRELGVPSPGIAEALEIRAGLEEILSQMK